MIRVTHAVPGDRFRQMWRTSQQCGGKRSHVFFFRKAGAAGPIKENPLHPKLPSVSAAPFLDRRLERRPWRRPISVGAFLLFVIAYTSLGIASYRDDYRDPGVAAQMRQQDEDAKAFMQKPFVPEAAAGSASAVLASADPKVLKGLAIFQAQSCSSCHGDGGMGTAAAGPLTGVGQKYTDLQLVTLLHAPDSKMTNGGMQPVDLKQDDLEALVAYLRQLR